MFQIASLNAPCPSYTTYGGVMLTEFMKLIYLARGDLTKRFSLETKFDRTVYLLWFLLYAKDLFKFSDQWLIEPSWEALEQLSPEYGHFEQAPLTSLQSALWFAYPLSKTLDLANAEDRLKIEMIVSCWKRRPANMPAVKPSAAAKLFAQQPQTTIINDSTKAISVFMYTLWTVRADLQEAFHLDTPEGRQGLVNWFDIHAKHEHDLSLLTNQLEIRTYDEQGTGIKKEFEETKLPQILEKTSQRFGINVIGSAISTSGMAKQGQMTALAAKSVNLPVCLLDHGNIGSEDISKHRFSENLIAETPKYFVNVASHNIDLVPYFINRIGELLDESYNIYYGNWEYPDYPPIWQEIVNNFDEVWAPSKFTLQTMANAVKPIVNHIPMAVTVAPGHNYGRKFFNLPLDSFLFLFTFDYWSWIERKNPLACISAFKLAFPKGTENASLIIKTKNVHLTAYSCSESWNLLKESAATDSRIIIIEKGFSDAEFYDLIRACDAYISLHRAEGFGFSIAEAMLLGKPTVVTNYSGNTEFTHSGNSCLVNYELVCVPPNSVLNIASKWAEPDVEHAAWQMRRLFDDFAYATNIGTEGQKFIENHYSLEKVGAQIKNRISQIYALN